MEGRLRSGGQTGQWRVDCAASQTGRQCIHLFFSTETYFYEIIWKFSKERHTGMNAASCNKTLNNESAFFFRIRRSVHRFCIRRVQPKRCNISYYVYFCMTLYMFQTVFPSIIRSSKLHVQRQVFVRPLLSPAASLSTSRKQFCNFEFLMMDGKTV